MFLCVYFVYENKITGNTLDNKQSDSRIERNKDMKQNSKSNKSPIITLLCICALGFLYCAVHTSEPNSSVQQGIAKEVIRFHVIANSDANVDQEVKLVVKDNVVKYMQGKLADASTREEAKKIMKEEMPAIKKLAYKTVKKEGYGYSCDVIYHKRNFPIKVYGDLTFPAGEYEALDVVLGSAQGKNWWCVMFPTLCFVDGTYSIVPDNSKQQLREVLTEEEFKVISSEKKVKVEYTFKMKEWYDKIVNKLSAHFS